MMRSALQVTHLVMLVLVSIAASVCLLALHSDPGCLQAGVLAAAAAGAWSGLVIVETLRHGDEATLRQKLYEAYRRLLNRNVPLIASNAGLAGILLLVVSGLLSFRPVEFYSPAAVRVALDPPGGPTTWLGDLEANSAHALRLPVGEAWLVFCTPGTSAEIVDVQRVEVVRPWLEQARINVAHDPANKPCPQ